MENLKQKTKSGTYETIQRTAALVLLETAAPLAVSLIILALIFGAGFFSNYIVDKIKAEINDLPKSAVKEDLMKPFNSSIGTPLAR